MKIKRITGKNGTKQKNLKNYSRNVNGMRRRSKYLQIATVTLVTQFRSQFYNKPIYNIFNLISACHHLFLYRKVPLLRILATFKKLILKRILECNIVVSSIVLQLIEESIWLCDRCDMGRTSITLLDDCMVYFVCVSELPKLHASWFRHIFCLVDSHEKIGKFKHVVPERNDDELGVFCSFL